jgi:hypothetical protein
MKKFKKCRCAAGLDSTPLEKVYSASWRKNFRSIKLYISLNYVGQIYFSELVNGKQPTLSDGLAKLV